jgi:hypothetical protein
MAGITLAQVAQLEKDPLKKYIGMQLLRHVKLWELLPFENVSALEVRALWWEKLPTGGAFRMVNEGYPAAQDGQLGDGFEHLYGFGGDIVFDKVLEGLSNVVVDPIKTQVDGRLESMAITWNNYLINGDVAVDPKGFNGLKKRVAAMPSRQTIWLGGSSAAALNPTASAANARKFINTFNMAWRYCNKGNVNAILCNESFIIGFSRVLALLQGYGNYLDVTRDNYGREEVSYRGVKFIDVGLLQDRTTEIIPENEPDGTASNVAMSFYLISINTQDGVYGIQKNQFDPYDPLNGGEMEARPAKMMRIDWWNGIASFGRYGIVRVRNLKNLAGWTE